MKQTPFVDRHAALGARMVDFAGWQMPIQYPPGILAEHLTTRRSAGLFDVSHMGRFLVCGPGAGAFLRHVLTNDCEKLPVGQAQYTILANDSGAGVDDAFLYRTGETDFLLVVNASNAEKDFKHLCSYLPAFSGVEFADASDAIPMLALQGPESEAILRGIMTEGMLPEAKRNAISTIKIGQIEVTVSRTGYTGEPVCFELFIQQHGGIDVWDRLIAAGAEPVGLGARDTLRLESGLPLYGHELGIGRDGQEIAIYAIAQARFATDFEDAARGFIGRDALAGQAQARKRYKAGDFSDTAALPKVVRQFRLVDKGIAREGSDVYHGDELAGWVSSGTMVPYWIMKDGAFTDTHSQRAIGLCLVRPEVKVGDMVEIEVRGRRLKAEIVARNLENRKGEIAFAVV